MPAPPLPWALPSHSPFSERRQVPWRRLKLVLTLFMAKGKENPPGKPASPKLQAVSCGNRVTGSQPWWLLPPPAPAPPHCAGTSQPPALPALRFEHHPWCW